MRSLAVELAPHHIRVNSIHATTVDTPMAANEAIWGLFPGGVPGSHPGAGGGGHDGAQRHAGPVGGGGRHQQCRAPPRPDEARHVTGTTTAVDAGAMQPSTIPRSA
ncbi:SDR family oxidoreductase [Geodermatophilus sp. SYSU D00697]